MPNYYEKLAARRKMLPALDDVPPGRAGPSCVASEADSDLILLDCVPDCMFPRSLECLRLPRG